MIGRGDEQKKVTEDIPMIIHKFDTSHHVLRVLYSHNNTRKASLVMIEWSPSTTLVLLSIRRKNDIPLQFFSALISE